MKKYKDKIKNIFDKTAKISCPAFDSPREAGGKTVFFNAKGINHLIYKGNRSRRSKKRIEANIRLLPRAIKLLKHGTFWQEESLYTRGGVKYKFWAFEAVVDNRRIKVIVRQVGNGNKHFWSVIPAWRRDKHGVSNTKGGRSSFMKEVGK